MEAIARLVRGSTKKYRDCPVHKLLVKFETTNQFLQIRTAWIPARSHYQNDGKSS